MMGFELKQARKAVRMRQTDLAELLDVTPATIANWEHGRRPISRIAELATRFVITEYTANRPIRVSRPKQPWQIRLRKWLLARV